MDRRTFVASTGLAAAAGVSGAAADQATPKGVRKIEPLANEFSVVYESPDPQHVYCYTPGICCLPGGRLIATMDRGGDGVAKLPGAMQGKTLLRGMIFSSDDHGKTWQQRSLMPMLHARPFTAGKSLYVLGHVGDLMIMRSDDGGNTWSQAVKLTEGEGWHQSACNVWYAKGKVYLVMENNTDRTFKGWGVSVLAPVLMAAKVDDDLTNKGSWTFASRLSFREAIKQSGEPHMIGVAFYNPGPIYRDAQGVGRRVAQPIGWLETNVVQFTDPSHIWHDPKGSTFHLFMRAHTAGTGLAAMAKVVEAEDGTMTTTLEQAPSGQTMLYVPMPGGQMRFHILWDEQTKLFWLLSSQATDSMIKPELMPAERFDLPNNERHRLALHFSRNCVDWCFAGLVAVGPSWKQSRHYASMCIDGDDLHVLSRSGDARAKSAHDGNLITCHTVPGFRELAYL